jgi:hypothetical protein
MSSLVVERSFHITAVGGQRGGRRNTLREGQELAIEPQPSGRIPRIAKLMALAIRCDQLLRSGTVPDSSALARLAKVSQPRMTQILNLTLLAPDIQERLLFLDPVEEGKPDVSEKELRQVCAELGWGRQRVNAVVTRS